MEHDFWHARWRQDQIGFHQPDVNRHLREHWPALGVTPPARVFVPLCGKSLDLLWLRMQGCEVVGIELSEVAVKAFFAEQGMTPEREAAGPFERWRCEGIELLCGDFFALTAADLGRIDAVYDRASLIALPEAMRGRYVAHLHGLLPPATPQLLVTLEYDQSLMSGPPFAVLESEVERHYGTACGLEHLARHDILDESPRFRAKGLGALHESIYRLHSPQAPDGKEPHR